jgi:hypothetical protein
MPRFLLLDELLDNKFCLARSLCIEEIKRSINIFIETSFINEALNILEKNFFL